MSSRSPASARPAALSADPTGHAVEDHNYRADIDGLRGVAVSAVVLFHAGVPGFSGGFVGVDVFFVISGFLITSIIAKAIGTNTFSLAQFYDRRIRRIFPALFTMLACSTIPAYFLLPPAELKLFAQSLLSAALFCSNFFFWSQTGYFDAPAETHPFLHTWSLAIEEQFYLVFPILFALAATTRRFNLTRLFAGIAAASLMGACWLSYSNPEAGFFASPVRAWELLIGSLLALRSIPLWRSRWPREAAVLIGLGLIVFSVTMAKSGPAAVGLVYLTIAHLVPCLGTALIIHAGLQARVNQPTTAASGLGSAGPVAIGKISYSWYLWHWPMIVFTKLYLERPLTGIETTVVIAATIVVAVGSYLAIEQPYRRPDGVFQRRGLFISAGATMAGLIALSVVTIVEDGFPKRFQRMLDLANPENKHRLCLLDNTQAFSEWGERRCLLNDVTDRVALLWGDSFAAHYLPAFIARRDTLGFNILQYNLEGCPPFMAEDLAPLNPCHKFNLKARDIIEQYQIKTVILAARWQSHFGETGYLGFDSIAPTIKWLQARGIRVAIIGQSPTFPASVPRMYWWRLKNGQLANADAAADPGHAFNARLQRATIGATFLEPSRALCSDPRTCRIGEGLKPYYWDTGHLTTTGSIRAMESLWQPLDDFMRAP